MITVPLSSQTPMYRLLATSSPPSFARLAGLKISRTSLKTRDCGFSARIFRLSALSCSRSLSRPLPRRFPTESLTRPRSQITTTSKALRTSSMSTLPPKLYRSRSSASTVPSGFQSRSSAASTAQFMCSCSTRTTPSRHHSKHKFSPPPRILTISRKPSR